MALRAQSGEHSVGRGSVVKQRLGHQVPGIQQKGKPWWSGIGVQARKYFQISCDPEALSFYISRTLRSHDWEDVGSEAGNFLTHPGKRNSHTDPHQEDSRRNRSGLNTFPNCRKS